VVLPPPPTPQLSEGERRAGEGGFGDEFCLYIRGGEGEEEKKKRGGRGRRNK